MQIFFEDIDNLNILLHLNQTQVFRIIQRIKNHSLRKKQKGLKETHRSKIHRNAT